MDLIRRLFGAKSKQIVKVDGDDVFPTSVLDDTKVFRDLMVAWTLCFNDVLDPDKLHSSLVELLNIGDWRKLGGRLSLTEDGRLEIHAPKKYTSQRPAVAFTKQSFDISISEHPLAKTIPSRTEGPSIQIGGNEFKDFVATPETPLTPLEMLGKDLPQITVRITTFTDATLVGLAWPHTLMDALGMQAMLKAWTLVLEGRASDVPTLVGAQTDSVVALTKEQNKGEAIEPFDLEPYQMKGVSLIMFFLRLVWSRFWNGAAESRSVFIPKKAIDRLRYRAMEEAREHSKDPNPFVSEGDVFAAWTTKILAASDPGWRPVTIYGALNLRYRIKSMMEASGIYAQNLTVGTVTFLTPAEARSSVGYIANKHRIELTKQVREPQLKSYLRSVVGLNAKGGRNFFYGTPDMLLVFVTNWTKAEIPTAADFSRAVVRPGQTAGNRTNPPGTITSFIPITLKQATMMPNLIRVTGRDPEGNYWLSGLLLPRTWVMIEEELKKL